MLKITPMGVMNVTPNSFSDGNSNLTPQDFINNWNRLLRWAKIIDIGAESTAPFNEKISEDEELKRLDKNFFNNLSSVKMPEVISFDTYKINVFKYAYERLKKKFPNIKIIFNDVSGQVDDELIELLESDRDFSYVFCHNLCPDRSKSNEHMNYKTSDLKSSIDEFALTASKLSKKKEIFFDPCFGFSKSRKQNLELFKIIEQGIHKWNLPIVYGISRKSFLRNPPDMNAKEPENQKFLTAMEAMYLRDLFKVLPKKEIIIRSHDQHAIEAAKFYHNINHS